MTTAIRSTTVPASTAQRVVELQPFSDRTREVTSSDVGRSDGAASTGESRIVPSESLCVQLAIDPAQRSRGVRLGEVCHFALLMAAAAVTVSIFGFALVDLCSAIAGLNDWVIFHGLASMH